MTTKIKAKIAKCSHCSVQCSQLTELDFAVNQLLFFSYYYNYSYCYSYSYSYYWISVTVTINWNYTARGLQMRVDCQKWRFSLILPAICSEPPHLRPQLLHYGIIVP